jgi:hypothetical protein
MTRKTYSIILWLLSIASPFAFILINRAVDQFLGIPSAIITSRALISMGVGAAIIYGFAIMIGMRCAQELEIRFLLLEEHPDLKRDLFVPGILAGVGCAAVVFLIDHLLPSSPLNLYALSCSWPLLTGFLGLIFAIVNQEVLLSLFAISSIAVLLKKMFNMSIAARMWISIVLATLLFMSMHIPLFIHTTVPDLGLLLLRIGLLTGIAGITFGYLYWKKSFETAVFAHIVIDFCVFVVVPMCCMLRG